MKKIIKFLKAHKNISAFLLLTALTFLSHGKTWQMYYWVDDWAMTYKVLWPEESPGNMGAGVFGNGGPYRYLVTPFIWLYLIFKFNATPYFVIGWIIYLFAAFSVYLLSLELTKKRPLALSASAIFASGYIGAHALYRLTNSYQTAGGTLFIVLSIWLFAKYLKKKGQKLYWLSLTLYTVSIEVFFIRTHGLFLSILGLSLFYKLTQKTKLTYRSLIIRLLPFFSIFYFMYFLDPRIKTQSNLVLVGLDAMTKRGEYALLNNFTISFANTLIPDGITSIIYNKLNSIFHVPPNSVLVLLFILAVFLTRGSKKIWKIIAATFLVASYLIVNWSATQKSSLWNPRPVELFTSLLGISLIICFLHLGVTLWQRKERLGLLIPYFVFWIGVNTLTLFVYSPETNLESTSRYLVPAFAGIGLLFAASFWLAMNKKLATVSTVIVCTALLYYSNKEADNLIKTVSRPDKQGYDLIQQEVKKVDENTVFYIESADDPAYKNNYLGRLPQLGISSLFKYHGITRLADSYPHLFAMLADKEVSPENTYTYFFGPGGYKSTTDNFRELLLKGGSAQEINSWVSNTPVAANGKLMITQTMTSTNSDRTVSLNPVLETVLTYNSLTPSVLELTMTLELIRPKDITFPFYDLSQEFPPNAGIKMLEAARPQPKVRSGDEIITAIEEEYEKQVLINSANAKASSSWKPGTPEDITDGRLNTNWSADNNKWNDGVKPQEIYIDFDKAVEISKIVWVNHHYMSTPTNYTFYTSPDGVNWQKLKEVVNGAKKDGGEEVVENLPKTSTTRYLKLSIEETYGGRGYPPGIKELWVSKQELEVAKNLKERILKCPFCYIPDSSTYEQTASLIQKIASARVWWKTDRNNAYNLAYSTGVPIYLDGQPHTYKIYLPPQGTKFSNLKLDGFQAPLKLTVHGTTIRSLSLEEAKHLRSLWDTGE